MQVRGHSLTPDDRLARSVRSFADLSAERPHFQLTRHEREILIHLSECLTSKEIALQLDISYHTVEAYRAKLLHKFNVSNTTSLFHSLGSIDGAHVVAASKTS